MRSLQRSVLAKVFVSGGLLLAATTALLSLPASGRSADEASATFNSDMAKYIFGNLPGAYLHSRIGNGGGTILPDEKGRKYHIQVAGIRGVNGIYKIDEKNPFLIVLVEGGREHGFAEAMGVMVARDRVILIFPNGDQWLRMR